MLLLIGTLPALATADVVTDWNAINDLVAPRFGGPQQQSRARAIVQIAVHDALNAIDSRWLRMNDGSDMPHRPYTLLPGPGVYQPTPNPEFPAVITPSFAGWAFVTPFVLRHHEQFEVEPGAIFDLAGAAYAQQYNEVKRLGDAHVRGTLPDSEESDIARFCPGLRHRQRPLHALVPRAGGSLA